MHFGGVSPSGVCFSKLVRVGRPGGAERQACAETALRNLPNALAQAVDTPTSGYVATPNAEYRPAESVQVPAPAQSHSEVGWVGGEPYQSHTTGSVNNGG